MKKLLWRFLMTILWAMFASATAPIPASGADHPTTAAVSRPSGLRSTTIYPVSSHRALIPDTCSRIRNRLTRLAARGTHLVMCIASARPAVTPDAPSRCHPNHETTTRFEDCVYSRWRVVIINANTGRVIGTVTGSTILWNSLSGRSRSWAEHIEVHITGLTGEGAGTTFTAPISCVAGAVPVSDDCQPTGTGHWAGQIGFLTARPGSIYHGELGFESITSATVEFQFQVLMTFENPAAANPT